LSKGLTRFTYYYAKRIRLTAVFVLTFGTSIFLIPSAQAVYANATIVCGASGGNQQSFQVGWDNSNQFFANKGYIPRLYCEGGYAGNYRTYISDNLNDSSLGYFNGVITSSSPTPSQPEPSPSPSPSESVTVDTATSTSPTDTPTPSSTPEPEPSPSASPETSTSQSSGQETQTSQTETPTVTPEQTETSTTSTDSATVVAPVDGSTATSEPVPQPAPTPPAPPVVEPEPVEEPVVAPEEEEVPLPEPEVEEEIAPEEAPEPVIEPEVEPEEEVIPEPEPTPEVEATVTLDNGVVLTQEQAVAVALLQDPVALVQELFTNPAAALAALGEVGADMSPEVREKSEKVVVSAVIAGNIATQAAATAGAVAAYRRKP
jgi:hypothetical protein